LFKEPIFKVSRRIRNEAIVEILRSSNIRVYDYRSLTWFWDDFLQAAAPHIVTHHHVRSIRFNAYNR
jgi:hypothetical protein